MLEEERETNNSSIANDLLNVNVSPNNKSSHTDINEPENITNSSNHLHFEKIDKMYEKLYDAINTKDLKKITFARGRLIRTLKRNKKEIKKLYEEIEPLEKINYLLSKDASMDEIRGILINKDNINYFMEFQDSLSNKESFKKQFDALYKTKDVKRIMMYYNALSKELECQKTDYNKRYKEEFLNKNGNIKTTLASFPKALALSVKSIANSINEIKESKTNKQKILNMMESLKGVGRLTTLPIVFTGKFITSIWYTLIGKLGIKSKDNKNDIQRKSSLDSLFLYDDNQELSTGTTHK